MTLVRRLRPVLLGAVAIGLSGCISVFPKGDPAQLYRFDGGLAAAAPSTGPAPQGDRFGVTRTLGGFAQAAGGDQIMTVSGSRVAYIADARWASPASVLFNEAVQRAFDANPGPARLLARGELGKAAYSLRIDVTRFETVYDRGERNAPTVVVALRVTLLNADRTLAANRQIEAQARADENRVSAIVAAYDEAVGKTLTELVDWTNARGT